MPKHKKQKQGRSSHKKNKSRNNKRGNRSTTSVWSVFSMATPHMSNTTRFDNGVHNFIQTSTSGQILAGTITLPAGAAKSFSSADLTQFSSFAAIFDQYRIHQVEMWLTPLGVAATATYPTDARFYSVVDYDDANVITSSTNFLQYENVTVSSLNTGHYIKFKPHMAVASYGGAFTQFANVNPMWIDVASTAVQHYGIKLGVDPVNANGDIKIDAFWRIHWQFRNVF
jgi:hypothetical protein